MKFKRFFIIILVTNILLFGQNITRISEIKITPFSIVTFRKIDSQKSDTTFGVYLKYHDYFSDSKNLDAVDSIVLQNNMELETFIKDLESAIITVNTGHNNNWDYPDKYSINVDYSTPNIMICDQFIVFCAVVKKEVAQKIVGCLKGIKLK